MADAPRIVPAGKPRRLSSVLARYPRIAGAFAAAIGAVTLFGWLTGMRAITYPVPGLPGMKAMTAMMSLLAGISLWLLSGARRARKARLAARVAAFALGVLALATLFEYAVGVELGIDRFVPGRWPGTAPHIAFAFGCIALGLLLIGRETARARRGTDVAAAVAGAIAVFALLGYLFGIPALYGKRSAFHLVGMSIPTALVLLMLALGIMTAQVERGVLSIALARDAGGIVARQLLAGLVAFPPIAIAVFLGARMGWYALSIASALMAFLTLAEASVFILATARRLSRFDAEQHRVTNELRASEARVRTLVEQAKDGIFLADADGRYLDVNPAGCSMLGYTRDEIVAKTFADLLHPDDLPRLERERASVISGGTSRNEWRLRRRDGSYVEVESVGNMLSDGRLQGFVRDITGRKQIERQLAEAFEAERELRADLEAVDTARTVVADAVATLHNAQIDDVLAQIAEQARKLTDAEYSAVGIGTDPTRQFEHWITAGMSDDVVRAIGRIPRPIGLLGHVVDHVEPLRVRDAATHPSSIGLPPHHPAIHSFLAMPIRRGGNVVGNIYLANKRHAAEFSDRDERLVALLADGIARATETARSFAAEVRLRTWLRSVIDQFPEGVIVIDREARVQAINQVMRAWAAEPHAIVRDVGGNPRQFDVRDLGGATVEFEQLPVIRALRTGESTDGVELLLGQSDGELLPVEARAAPIRDEAGAIAGAVVVVHDVSERKHIERLREEWLAVIAHDLRQPVSAIVAATGLLIEHIAPDREAEILNGLRDAAFRMNRMVTDLLDAGRIASNQLALRCRPIEIVGVVVHSIEQLRLASPGVEVVIDAPREQVAWGDPQRLEQVLDNLLSNAVKYRTPDTAIRVEVSHDEDAVRVCVCNEGTPIAPQEQSTLFTRFTRTRGAIAEHKPGVGLGLYICKGLVEAHGGRIWVESRSGWTKFSFTVPAQDRCRS